MVGKTTLKAALALTILAGSDISATAVTADQPPACAERSNAISHLADKYRERPVAMGLANNGGVIEVLTSDAGGTWSILVTMPDGTTCIVAAGQHWERVSPIGVQTGL